MDPFDEPGLGESSEWSYICHALGVPESRVLPFMQQWTQTFYEYQHYMATHDAKRRRELELGRELAPLRKALARFDATLPARLADGLACHLDVAAAAGLLAHHRLGVVQQITALETRRRTLRILARRDLAHCADLRRAEHNARLYFRLMQDTLELGQTPVEHMYARTVPEFLAARYRAIGMPVPHPDAHRPWSYDRFRTQAYRLQHEAEHAAATQKSKYVYCLSRGPAASRAASGSQTPERSLP